MTVYNLQSMIVNAQLLSLADTLANTTNG